MSVKPEPTRWIQDDLGGGYLYLPAPLTRIPTIPAHMLKPGDPTSWMLLDGVETTPTVYSPTCYICNDPEFARMELPLCYACAFCGGHVAADDTVCDACGRDTRMMVKYWR